MVIIVVRDGLGDLGAIVRELLWVIALRIFSKAISFSSSGIGKRSLGFLRIGRGEGVRERLSPSMDSKFFVRSLFRFLPFGEPKPFGELNGELSGELNGESPLKGVSIRIGSKVSGKAWCGKAWLSWEEILAGASECDEIFRIFSMEISLSSSGIGLRSLGFLRNRLAEGPRWS